MHETTPRPGRARSVTWKATASALVAAGLVASAAQPADARPRPHALVALPSTSTLVAATDLGTATGGVKGITKALKESTTGVLDSLWGDDSTLEGLTSRDLFGTWVPSRDQGSLVSIADTYGITKAWKSGVTGRGVTVAVVDTGIAPVPGLDAAGKVVDGPDLSYDGQAPGTRYVDGYGHGTHLAGIIAGEDASFDPAHPDQTSFAGIAPEAQLLNMKVGAGDGGADVSQVVAALDWVVAHRRDHGMNVRVVSLAYGTESVQPWQVDPLAHAVESAWRHGIVVVTAAGNDGTDAPSLLMPAVDPHVLAVGAVDHEGTSTQLDDAVAAFTNGGSAERRPDLLAPGKSVVSLRVPGSYADREHPEGLVVGDRAKRYFRGSGTSQATAVAAGEVALLLQARPELTPDQVKAVLTATADPLVLRPSPVMGSGVLDLAGALRATAPATPSAAVRALPASSGTGSLEASRGGTHVVDPETGVLLTGEVDALGSPWRSEAWADAATGADSWAGGDWNGRTWTGEGWTGDRWTPASWTGDSWSGRPWADHTWSAATWAARSWRDGDWSARSWRSESWSARSWRNLP